MNTVSFRLGIPTLIFFEIIIARADNADEFLIAHLALLRRNPGPPRGRLGVIRG